MKYVPANSNIVVAIDVKKALASPLMQLDQVKKGVEGMKQESEFKKLTDAGIDPFNNVDSVLISGDITKDYFAMVVKGSFDAAKAVEAAKKDMNGDKETAEVLGPNMIIVGTKDAVASAKEGKGIDGSPALKDLWSAADTSRAIYGAVAIPGEMLKDVAAMSPSAEKIKGIAGGIDVSAGIDIKAVTRFADAAGAEAAKKESDAQLPMAKGMLTGFGVPAELIDALSVTVSGTDVTIAWKISTDQIKDLVTKFGAMMGGMGGGMPSAPEEPANP